MSISTCKLLKFLPDRRFKKLTIRGTGMKNARCFLLAGLLTVLISCQQGSQFQPVVEGPHSAKIDDLIMSRLKPEGPGALIAVIQDGEFVHKKGYGYGDLERKSPLTSRTQMYLASVSKQFTAMTIMILAEQGKLSFDDHLHDFFPDFPEEWKDITLHHIMTHTSGLTDMFALPGMDNDVDNQDVLKALIEKKTLDFAPGEKYSYSNSGYIMQVLIVEKLSGVTFDQFVKKNIFEPLGMSDSFVYTANSVFSDRARGYEPADEGYDVSDYNLRTMGGGGFFSTIDDLFKWNQALYTEKLVSYETLDRAFTGHVKTTTDEREVYYGYGWSTTVENGLKIVEHTGSLRGFRNINFRIPEKRFSVIILSNAGIPRQDRPLLAREIAGYFLEEFK